MRNKRIAIVHDSISYFGGAERVLYALHKTFPTAPIYTTVIYLPRVKNQLNQYFPAAIFRTSWLNKFSFFQKYPFLFRYFLPFVWNSLDMSAYDIIISSSGAQMSHFINISAKAKHICYLHTPPRHLYGYKTDFAYEKFFFLMPIIAVLNGWLRKLDYSAAQKVTKFYCASQEVQGRIKKHYQREASILPPPVMIPRSAINKVQRQNYFLSVSRLSRMKHVDIIVRACNSAKAPLIVIGTGPEEKRLRAMAGPTIIFMGSVDDKMLWNYYNNCIALICAAEDEDYGITPDEAYFFNKLTIAYKRGGFNRNLHLTRYFSLSGELENIVFEELSKPPMA